MFSKGALPGGLAAFFLVLTAILLAQGVGASSEGRTVIAWTGGLAGLFTLVCFIIWKPRGPRR